MIQDQTSRSRGNAKFLLAAPAVQVCSGVSEMLDHFPLLTSLTKHNFFQLGKKGVSSLGNPVCDECVVNGWLTYRQYGRYVCMYQPNKRPLNYVWLSHSNFYSYQDIARARKKYGKPEDKEPGNDENKCYQLRVQRTNCSNRQTDVPTRDES